MWWQTPQSFFCVEMHCDVQWKLKKIKWTFPREHVNKQWLIAELWKRDSDTKREFYNRKKATLEDIHLMWLTQTAEVCIMFFFLLWDGLTWNWVGCFLLNISYLEYVRNKLSRADRTSSRKVLKIRKFWREISDCFAISINVSLSTRRSKATFYGLGKQSDYI